MFPIDPLSEINDEDDDSLDPLDLLKLLLETNNSKIKNREKKFDCTFDFKDVRNFVSKTLKFVFRFIATMGVFYLSAKR